MPISSATLRLWQLVSPALPVGAFAYSQGLEHLIDSRTLDGAADVETWIGELLEQGPGRTDLPMLLRLHRAARAGDTAGFDAWCDTLVALRETSELRAEDLGVGTALARLLDALGVAEYRRPLPFAAAFATACAAWTVPADAACAGLAWAWCENQVQAAVKLVPLGHTAGQRMLLALGDRIEAVAARAAGFDDADVGNALPGLAIASARHETQYSRLFRS